MGERRARVGVDVVWKHREDGAAERVPLRDRMHERVAAEVSNRPREQAEDAFVAMGFRPAPRARGEVRADLAELLGFERIRRVGPE